MVGSLSPQAGYYRAGNPDLFDSYVFSGLVIEFLVLTLVTGVWLLFDENVAKPIERLATAISVRAPMRVSRRISTPTRPGISAISARGPSHRRPIGRHCYADRERSRNRPS